MDVYAELGVTPVINAAGTLTNLGGSLMPPEVLEAMAAAARSFVDMDQLHRAAGRRIAELIGVEAAHVCDGAASGISLMAAACMAGTDRERIARLPDTAGMRNRFVVQASHRNPFDQALRVSGGGFVQIDADADQLRQAVRRPDVAGVFYTHAWFCMGPALELAEVAEIAHQAGVPVIVDAAAEVPPPANLTRFVREGADLVTFSGGKAIRGPQASGIILGRADLVEACRLNNSPNMGIGRPMKVGKEEIVGLVKAVELYLGRDHAGDAGLWERRVRTIIAAVSDLPTVRAWRQLPYGVGQQIPHAAVTWDVETVGADHVEVMRRLRQGDPPIAVQYVSPDNYHWSTFTEPELRLHPHTLQEGEAEVVARRLREALGG
ncbi:MAG: aminotransferase class V-fold PLP-dependent enzyme [Anaerolineae bacterium]|nr:aminotransferase class V-fold PLP-dependent enzyme [Anaerolineae bacterium]